MRKNFLKILALSGVFLTGAISLTSCDIMSIFNGGNNNNGGENVQTSYSLNKTSLSLEVGQSDVLIVEGISASDVVTWSSTNAEVVSVNDGTVTANKAGSATIKAVIGDTLLQCAVTVTGQAPQVTYLHLTYDPNGGTGSIIDDNDYVAGNKVTLEECTFTPPAGQIFTVWNTKADGSGTNYAAKGKMTILEDTTLYAQWVDQSIIPPPPVDTTHKIKVNTVNGVSAVLSKSEAEAGETITLTVSLDDGVSLDGNPTSAQVTIGKISENVFGFTMPNEDVWINIKISLSGDVIVTGDFGAILKDDDGDGIYVAENVVVPSDQTRYGFSYAVKDNEGGLTRLDSTQLDETRCDANVTFNTGSSLNKLSIAGGCTYDFYYDTNVNDFNCYIVRKSVDVLPSNGAGIYALFEGRMRSQSTIHPQGLTGIHYEKVTDATNSEAGLTRMNVTYDYKKISETRSFAKATDNLNSKVSYVYKDIDEATNIYSVVNTYTKRVVNGSHIEGNNEEDDRVWSLNPYGGKEGDYYKPFSAKLDIVPDGFYNNTSRTEITSREAKANINAAAHVGSVLEYEIYESHRGDFDGTAVINAANPEGSHITVTSTPMAGGFRTVVSSQLEYNHVESGSTADVTQQFATIYSNEFRFLTNGDLYSMDYKAEFYEKNNWDFTNHQPAGTSVTTTIKITNSYNKVNENAATLGDFDVNDYFISQINYLKFYNDNTAVSETSEKSHVAYGDELGIVKYLNEGKYYPVVKEVLYTPDTALDLWQCQFDAAENKHIIGLNEYNRLAAIGVGTTTMSFTNGTSHSAYTKTISIEVHASGNYHGLFVNCTKPGYDSYNNERADTIVGYAGKTMTYYIDASSNTGAPVSYYFVFESKNSLGQIMNSGKSDYFSVENCEIIHVDDNDLGLHSDCYKVTGHALTMNFNTNKSNALTSPVTIKAYLVSDFYTPGWGPSTLSIVVNPASDPIVNTTWEAVYTWSNSDAIYERATVEFKDGGLGTITERLYNTDGTTLRATNIFNFSYNELNSGKIESVITSVSVGESGLPTTATSYVVYFEYFPASNVVGVALYFTDSNGYVNDIFGQTLEDDEGYIYIENLDGFSKVVS